MIQGIRPAIYDSTKEKVLVSKQGISADSNVVQDNKSKNVDSIEITAHKNPLETPNSQQLEYWRLHGNRFSNYESYSGHNKVSEEIREMYDGYYAGTISVEEVKDKFHSIVEAVWEFDDKEGIASKEDKEHYGKIVADVNYFFRFYAVWTASNINHAEGKQIANQYGQPGNRNFLYYNSDYYYQSKEVTDTVFQAATKLTEDAGTVLHTKDLQVKYDYFQNFNTAWMRWARYEARMGDMIDPNIEPPRGFKLLYKEFRYTPEEAKAMSEAGDTRMFDGILQVSCGDWKAEGNVTMGYGQDEAWGHHALELLSKFAEVKDEDVVSLFLKNFNFHKAVYTNVYLFRKGLL